MTTALTMTPADVLRQAADWLAADPARWGRQYFIDAANGCRCALGAVAQVLDPNDEDGNPTTLRDHERNDLGVWVADFLANYLVDYAGAPLHASGVHDDAVETVANWNDESARDASDVIAALRGAADEFDARRAARQARAS